MIRRLIAAFLLAITLLIGVGTTTPASAAPDAPEAPAKVERVLGHTYIHSVCEWTAVEYWGPGEVGIVAYYAINFYGDTSVYYCKAYFFSSGSTYYCVAWLVDVDPGGVVTKVYLGKSSCFS